MSTYKGIFGKTIKHLSSDPDNSTYEGQIWYNTTEGKFKTVVATGAWSSSSPTLNEFSYGSCSLQAAQTAGIFGAGGSNPKNKSESYNGTGYTSEANLTNARGNSECGGGGGTATTALCMQGHAGGGTIIANTEEYNGTSWSEIADLNQSRIQVSGAGTNTAAICFSGSNGPGGTVYNNSEEWNGTSWTEGNNLSTSRRNSSGNGIQTSAISIGGVSGTTVYNTTEEYDGTSWTAGTNYPSNIRGVGIIASTSTDAIGFGGNNPPSAIPAVGAKQYDGTAWTAVADLASTKQNPMAGGTTSAGLAVGGPGGSAISTTEEWNFTANTITAAAWASGGDLNTARFGLTGFGTQTSSIAANGDAYPLSPNRFVTSAEEYNGSTWTNISATSHNTAYSAASKLSPVSAGSVFGGEPVSARHEYWDGSSWSEQTDANSPRYSSGGAGTQTASIIMGGIPGAPGNTATEEWDGSAWTNQNNMPFGTYNTSGTGTQTAALIFGGNNPSVDTTAEYDGTNWTVGGSLINAREQLAGSGIQTNALAIAGGNPPTTAINKNEGYDGTSWSTRPTLGTARKQLAGTGQVSPASLAFGGWTTGKVATTEEFTGESTSINIESVDNS